MKNNLKTPTKIATRVDGIDAALHVVVSQLPVHTVTEITAQQLKYLFYHCVKH